VGDPLQACGYLSKLSQVSVVVRSRLLHRILTANIDYPKERETESKKKKKFREYLSNRKPQNKPVFRNYTSTTFSVESDGGYGVLKASWTGPSSFLSGPDRRICLTRKGLLSDLANGRSADGLAVLRRVWTRQRYGPLQMSARRWSAICHPETNVRGLGTGSNVF